MARERVQRRSFSAEVKFRAVQGVLEGGVPLAVMARENDISPALLHRWIRAHQAAAATAAPSARSRPGRPPAAPPAAPAAPPPQASPAPHQHRLLDLVQRQRAELARLRELNDDLEMQLVLRQLEDPEGA